jgi:hypothetical protein
MMQLEDAMHVLKMTTATRTRGRKPNGYKPLTTIKDVFEFVLDKELNRLTAAGSDIEAINQSKVWIENS